MRKQTTIFICESCGYQSPKWLGQCPECRQWNTLAESRSQGRMVRLRSPQISQIRTSVPQTLAEVKTQAFARTATGISELDRCLNGGLVPGQVILLAGEPGIGKSTILLQVAEAVTSLHPQGVTDLHLSKNQVLYISGEESAGQIKMRAERLKIKGENIQLLNETNLETILENLANNQHLRGVAPSSAEATAGKSQHLGGEKNTGLVIIDSVQTLYSSEITSSAGSISQVRFGAQMLAEWAKNQQSSLILVSHITKEGTIAGPKAIEHIVDTVLYLEGERFENLRLLRVLKNRFGPTDELGLFQMTEMGLISVENPAELFLNQNQKPRPGACPAVILEGTRPLIVEVEALTNPAMAHVPPRRVAQGLSYERLTVLCAVLQKTLRLPLYSTDVFVKVSGGLKTLEPGIDLAVCLAIISSLKNKPLPKKIAAVGEVGLLGDIKPVLQMEKRLKEAKKLGYEVFPVPNSLTELVGKIFRA